MKLCRIFIFVLAGALAGSSASLAADAPSPAPPTLPKQFGGWQMQGTAQASANPSSADAANAGVLKEFDFTDIESSAYTRDDGRTLKIRAARFEDASGAFGAYTFYLQPEMLREQIGDQGASLNQRVLFYRGNILVDAVFSQLSAMSAAELRELAGMLPKPAGNAGNLPPILAFMPHQDYVANTQKYVMGPVAFGGLSSPLSAQLIDFSASAEVVLGKYSTPGGAATLMLIEYPTPQMAADHLRKIEAAHQMAQSQPGVTSVGDAGPFFDKRTGPIIAIASGPLSQRDAQALLGLVNYEANVTWNENTYFDKKNNLANYLVNVIILCGILMGLAVAIGLGFGGLRILIKRFFPDRVFDRPEQMEFISLRLTETLVEKRGGGHSEGSSRTANSPPKSR